jgi:hypothetical protein
MPASSFRKGDTVEVFYRVTHNANGYIPVCSDGHGAMSPRIGFTHKWMEACVVQDFDSSVHSSVRVRYTHRSWFRGGRKLDTADDDACDESVSSTYVRRTSPACTPLISFFVVRWGGREQCDAVVGEDGGGGWGASGSVTSNLYFDTLFEHIHAALGASYEVLGAFCSDSTDLTRLEHQMPSLTATLRGPHRAGMYFLWPAEVVDQAYIGAGFVQRHELFALMAAAERCGVSTRFPHPSHVYNVFASKDWMCHMCLSPCFKVPATTKVSRAAVICELTAETAAHSALAALHALQQQQLIAQQRPRLRERPQFASAEGAVHGVAKLGFSWEASSVLAFDSPVELAHRLRALLSRTGCTATAAFVQEKVERVACEIRTFVVDGEPSHKLYTRFEPADDDGRFCEFRHVSRAEALSRWFDANEAALAHAERKINRLARRWALWLRTECSEVPAVFRLDCFVRPMRGPGNENRCEVFTGELTETGGSMLGWADGPRTLFAAILRSCFRDIRCSVSSCVCRTGAADTFEALMRPVRSTRRSSGSSEPRADADGAGRATRKRVADAPSEKADGDGRRSRPSESAERRARYPRQDPQPVAAADEYYEPAESNGAFRDDWGVYVPWWQWQTAAAGSARAAPCNGAHATQDNPRTFPRSRAS